MGPDVQGPGGAVQKFRGAWRPQAPRIFGFFCGPGRPRPRGGRPEILRRLAAPGAADFFSGPGRPRVQAGRPFPWRLAALGAADLLLARAAKVWGALSAHYRSSWGTFAVGSSRLRGRLESGGFSRDLCLGSAVSRPVQVQVQVQSSPVQGQSRASPGLGPGPGSGPGPGPGPVRVQVQIQVSMSLCHMSQSQSQCIHIYIYTMPLTRSRMPGWLRLRIPW